MFDNYIISSYLLIIIDYFNQYISKNFAKIMSIKKFFGTL